MPPNFIAAAAFVVLATSSIPARAGDEAAASDRATVIQAPDSGNCASLKRAISRRACLALQWRDMHIDTAENE